MTPEQDVPVKLLGQFDASLRRIVDAEALLGVFPADIATFEASGPAQRVAAAALLKSFEQLQDGLARVSRTMLRSLGVNLKGLCPLDIAHRMVELDALDDAPRWLVVVKLRNELVHEYPASAESRFEGLRKAHHALAFLSNAAQRALDVIEARGLLHG